MAIDPTFTPRAKLHHLIRRVFTTAITKHFREHPEKLNDPDTENALKRTLALMEEILAVVDQFEIVDRPVTLADKP